VTDGFVADSSVGVAWAVLSQSSQATEALLNEVGSGRPLIVPVLWMFEVANSLLVLMRRQRIEHEQCVRARLALGRLTIGVDEEGPRLAWGKISDLAEERALSVYDAVYLELAMRRGVPLASRDAALNEAAKRCGVKVLL